MDYDREREGSAASCHQRLAIKCQNDVQCQTEMLLVGPTMLHKFSGWCMNCLPAFQPVLKMISKSDTEAVRLGINSVFAAGDATMNHDFSAIDGNDSALDLDHRFQREHLSKADI